MDRSCIHLSNFHLSISKIWEQVVLEVLVRPTDTPLPEPYSSLSRLILDGENHLVRGRYSARRSSREGHVWISYFPLMKILRDDNLRQKWYADDRNAVGSLEWLAELHRKLGDIWLDRKFLVEHTQVGTVRHGNRSQSNVCSLRSNELIVFSGKLEHKIRRSGYLKLIDGA